MRTTVLKPIAGSLAFSLLLSACTLAPHYQQPEVNVPAGFRYDTAAGQNSNRAADTGWEDYFADPRLKSLITLALQNNPDLRMAALNAEAVRAQYAITRAASLPGINASGTGQRARVAQDLSATGRSYIAESYNVGLGIASYELDLFGKARSNNQAALQGYFSSAAARDSAHLALVSAVAKAYFNERYAEESMKLAQRVLQTREQTYRLNQIQHNAGVISAVNLREMEALIESAKADYAAALRAREQAHNALAVLINQPVPNNLPAGLPLNKQFRITQLPAGLSSDLLQNRPDIRAAEHNLRQANANIGAARAAFFPSISITSSIGTGSTEMNRLFDGINRTWVFSPTIKVPIFNWGSLRASLDVAKLRQQSAVAAYEKAVQSAFQDVSNALVARETLQQQYDARVQTQKAYNDRLRLINLRYRHGVSSSLEVLDAERSSYSADAAVLATQLSMLENLADLYKALGGGLKQHTEAAPTAAATPAQAAAEAASAPAAANGK